MRQLVHALAADERQRVDERSVEREEAGEGAGERRPLPRDEIERDQRRRGREQGEGAGVERRDEDAGALEGAAWSPQRDLDEEVVVDQPHQRRGAARALAPGMAAPASVRRLQELVALGEVDEGLNGAGGQQRTALLQLPREMFGIGRGHPRRRARRRRRDRAGNSRAAHNRRASSSARRRRAGRDRAADPRAGRAGDVVASETDMLADVAERTAE